MLLHFKSKVRPSERHLGMTDTLSRSGQLQWEALEEHDTAGVRFPGTGDWQYRFLRAARYDGFAQAA